MVLSQALYFFPYWGYCVQPKHRFFAWEASWGKILTLDQLQKRGIALANWCFLCQRCEETGLSSTPLNKGKGVIGDVFLSFCCLMGEPFLGLGHLMNWNGSFTSKE